MTTYNMSDDEYKQYISEICNRIIREKLINIVKDRNSQQIVFKIQINPAEWYMEMDDDIKFNVEYNLQILFKPLIIEAINEYNASKEEINNTVHKNKRQKI